MEDLLGDCDEGFEKVLDYTKSAFDMALHFVEEQEAALADALREDEEDAEEDSDAESDSPLEESPLETPAQNSDSET